MHYRQEFPDYDDTIIIPKGFQDHSYHNDISPHIAKTIMEDKDVCIELRIWQDYKDPELREREGKRYIFQIHIYTDVMDDLLMHYETDDWGEIEKMIDMVQYPFIPERGKA